MSVDGIVLVHGASHSARCWDLVLRHLVPAIAVDLPGRGSSPADFASVTLDDCVRAVIDGADTARLSRFALVGHSLGGVTITETAYRHPDRVAHLVYIGAIIPAPGESAAAVVFGADLTAEMGQPNEDRCRATMGNDMTDAQWVAHWPTIIPEPVAIWNARLSGYPDGMPTAFITMADDAGAPPELTKRSMANLGGDVDRRVVQGAHLAMITKPGELAGLINDIVNC